MLLVPTFGQASARDLSSVRALLRHAALPESDLQPAHMSDFFVCESAAGVCACVGLERFGELGLLRSLVVEPEARGRGLGGEAVRTVENHARNRGVKRLYLLTTTATRFFLARGYALCPREELPTAIRETTEFTALCPDSATGMGKELAP